MTTQQRHPMRQWLAEAENTDHIYAISKQVVETLDPYELIFFDEIFPRYVELAQKGNVRTAKQAAKEFSLVGDEVLLTFIILQALIRVLELLLEKNNSTKVVDIRVQIDPDSLPNIIEDALKQGHQTRRMRERVRKPIAQAIINEFGDIYTPYEIGLARLLAQLGQAHSRYVEALTYQQKLTENISQTRRYRDTQMRRSERTEVIEQLNLLALSELELSFNELCKKES